MSRRLHVTDYLSAQRNFGTLSLIDLLNARDQFHVHLMHKANVIGTAIGRYRIRKDDSWPKETREGAEAASPKHGHGKRTLTNSEVRPYSWPAVLVFVDQWISKEDFHHKQAAPSDFIPPAIYMPNGDVVPICVIEAERDSQRLEGDGNYMYPGNYIGGGYPIIAEVQKQDHVASVACLMTDGHLVYALTNRHVTGAAGETIYSILDGNRVPIGRSSSKQLTRQRFEHLYPGWPGKDLYVNLDIGLIEVDDVNRWTTQVYGIGEIGELADLSVRNLTLTLIGCPVIAHGAASGLLKGEICALFYRYAEMGGSEYVSDFLIGPNAEYSLGTRPGDSGTLWLIESKDPAVKPMPVAIQWGGQAFLDGGQKTASTYALATCLSTVSDQLAIDLIRDWNIAQPQYWGAVGHYSIANKACGAINNANLKKLMTANLDLITYDVAQINKKTMQGLSTHDFVALADVPDMVWKVGPHKRGPQNSPEHANHFADMDRKLNPPLPLGDTLLNICNANSANVSVPVWQQYYDEVKKQFPTMAESRGLLPFRVQQFYEGMVEFVKNGDVAGFVCAAGIVSHYVGDACQPLHISYMFNGDPDHTVLGTVTDPKTHQKVPGQVPTGQGVHSAYEDDMVNANVTEILSKTGIDQRIPAVNPLPLFSGGHAAAVAVVQLMTRTFAAIQPQTIIDTFVPVQTEKPAAYSAVLWAKLGKSTMDVMADGCLSLAQIWDSAWKEGGGDQTIKNFSAISQTALEKLYQDPNFMPSHTLDTISSVLGSTVPAPVAPKPAKKKNKKNPPAKKTKTKTR
jgi:hypothetical protein